jgi:hypothetical protein
MHVASFPNLVNPFFVTNTTPFRYYLRGQMLRTGGLPEFNAHIACLCWACFGPTTIIYGSSIPYSLMATTFQRSRITQPSLAVPTTVYQHFNFASVLLAVVCELYSKECHLCLHPCTFNWNLLVSHWHAHTNFFITTRRLGPLFHM